jgi:hypothetical protein
MYGSFHVQVCITSERGYFAYYHFLSFIDDVVGDV